MKKLIFAYLVFLFAPMSVFASVKVNEVAWMGDAVSADHEWVELYNDGESPQDISGWKLAAFDTNDSSKEKFSFSLSGTVPAKGYFLIERKRGTNDTSPYISSDFTGGSFSLLNTGETLILKNADELQMDEVKSLATKWPAGDNATKETMQKGTDSWITAKATPKAENVVSSSASVIEIVDKDKTSIKTFSGDTPAPETSAHLSPLPLSSFSDNQDFFISAGRDRIALANGVLPFAAYARDASGKKAQGISFLWSFGDGSTASGSKVFHTYEFPGEYIVILNASYNDSAAVSRANVRVLSPDMRLSLENNENETVAVLFNRLPDEINASGWKLRDGSMTYVFPEDTVIGPKKKVTLSSTVTKFQIQPASVVEIVSPNGKVISRTASANEGEVENASTSTLIFSESLSGKISASTTVPDISPVVSIKKTPAPVSATRYQYAAAVDVSKHASSTGQESQTITFKKPEGFFARMWHLFFGSSQ